MKGILDSGFESEFNNSAGNLQRSTNDLESIEIMFAKAVRHHRYGELSKAEVLYQGILVREPNHAAAMKKYGVLAFQFSDFLLAEQMFEQAYSMTPFDEQLAINLVMCKLKLEKPADVLPVIQAILKNNPDSEVGKDLYARINAPVPNPEKPKPEKLMPEGLKPEGIESEELEPAE